MAIEISLLTDEALYNECQQYGALALYNRRKFMGLLPEVNRRRLYERRGFSSIFEFAFKLAGLSGEQVKTALRLNEQFEDMPILRSLLETGKVSINKLARIASLATPENEIFLASQVQILSQKSVETLAKDVRSTNDKNGPQIDSMRAHDLKISNEVLKQLIALQEKGVDLNALFLEFLTWREQTIEEEKQELSQNRNESRPFRSRTKNLLKKEHGTKCAIPHCKNRAEEIHHTNRYALAKNHNPYYLAPLCKQHHQIAHSIDQKVLKHRQATVEPPRRPPQSAS